MTPVCCRGPRMLENIWLRQGARRVGLLGQVHLCIQHERPIGDVRAAPLEHRGPAYRPLKPEEWLRLVQYRPWPPYYFVLAADGRLLPEDWTEGAPPIVPDSMQGAQS